MPCMSMPHDIKNTLIKIKTCLFKNKKQKCFDQQRIAPRKNIEMFDRHEHFSWQISISSFLTRNKEFAPCCGLMSECKSAAAQAFSALPHIIFDRLKRSWIWERVPLLLAGLCHNILRKNFTEVGLTHNAVAQHFRSAIVESFNLTNASYVSVKSTSVLMAIYFA